MQLALKYRPRTFTDLVGQAPVQLFLREMVRLDRVPTALLFSGCRGTGKTTTARILAAALNCTNPDRPCGQCQPCQETFDGSSLDVLEIDAASNGLVDDIRDLRQRVRYRQTGSKRIVILDEAQSISPQGFNALLKTLEEPPPDTHFILLTTEINKILPTVASRCIPFVFHRLTIRDIADRLAAIAAAEQYACEPDLLLLLAERADGAMRDAVNSFDQISRVGMTTADQYRRLIGQHDHAPAILKRLTDHDVPGGFTELNTALTRVADPATLLDDIARCLRDVLVLRLGGEINKSGTALADRQNLALALDDKMIATAINLFWHLPPGDNRIRLELLVIKLGEVFAAVARPNTTRLNLADLGGRA